MKHRFLKKIISRLLPIYFDNYFTRGVYWYHMLTKLYSKSAWFSLKCLYLISKKNKSINRNFISKDDVFRYIWQIFWQCNTPIVNYFVKMLKMSDRVFKIDWKE
jgi:Ni,Fe-hydrogenase I cytochrome b subunit